MVRTALVSNHIVLTESILSEDTRYPRSGIILIEDQRIFDVVLVDDTKPLTSLFEDYADWNPEDYSHFYISPGVIDLTTRSEWESLSDLTHEAAQGGTTLMVIEPGYYHHIESSEEFQCDVIKAVVVDENSIRGITEQDPSVIKIYLFPPALGVKSVSSVAKILKKAVKLNKPVFIDANLPDPRMLYMASPFRFEQADNRSDCEMVGVASFASAFHQESDSSPDDCNNREDSDDEILTLLRSGSLATKTDQLKPKIKDKGPIAYKELDLAQPFLIEEGKNTSTKEKGPDTKRKGSDIYYDLDKRIKSSENLYEDLIKAEASTYNKSGQTSYKSMTSIHRNTHSLSCENPIESPIRSPDTDSTPTSSFMSRFSTRIAALNIQPLITKNPSPVKEDCDYNQHLANCPADWETDGVRSVLKCINETTKVHFTGLSSAVALNLIRKAKERFKNITCEVSSVSLCFTNNFIHNGDTRFKNFPPIRNASNNNLLWDLLKMKAIDSISSSHASILPSKKKNLSFKTALNGISANGCSLQSIWYLLNKANTENSVLEHYIVRLAKWLSLHPAQILGVSNDRGSICPGKFADLVIWDPKERYRLGNSYSYISTTPFAGQEMQGKVVKVYVRGCVVYENVECPHDFQIRLNKVNT